MNLVGAIEEWNERRCNWNGGDPGTVVYWSMEYRRQIRAARRTHRRIPASTRRQGPEPHVDIHGRLLKRRAERANHPISLHGRKCHGPVSHQTWKGVLSLTRHINFETKAY